MPDLEKKQWGYPCVDTNAYDSVIQGTWVCYMRATQFLGAALLNTTTDLNDELQYKFSHKSGSFNFKLLHITGADHAIITIYVDGVSQGTIDLYHAITDVQNVISTLAITITKDGEHTLNIKATSKNVASTDYAVFIGAWWITD